MKNFVMALLLISSTIGMANNGPMIFHTDGFLGSQKQAQLEGKFHLIEFIAKWCLPCKHMEETTFKDPTVIDFLREHFVSAKVDIDDFDGFALKQEYNVKYLPTILVFDNNGNVIAKFEEAMAPSKFKEELGEVVKNNTKPKVVGLKTVVQDKTEITDNTLLEPDLELQEFSDQVVPQQRILITNKCILQFGVFSSLNNARNLLDQISQVLPSTPQIESLEKENGTVIFALRYGPFNERLEAQELQEELLLLGYDCIIKKMK